MSSQKRRRRKKAEAKGLRPSITKPPRPVQYMTISETLAEVGGIIRAVTEPEQQDGRLVRSVMLHCHYGESKRGPKVSSPWLTVYDETAERVAGLKGQPICLGGSVRSLPETDPRTRRKWHIAVESILFEGRTNEPGAGRFARNTIVVRGRVESRKDGVAKKSREPKCDFVVCCLSHDQEIELIEMTAYDLPAIRIKEWDSRRKLHLVANVITYKDGSFTITSLVPHSVAAATSD